MHNRTLSRPCVTPLRHALASRFTGHAFPTRALRAYPATGGVIAYATESCYGLGCDPMNARAVARILRLKGRPKHKGHKPRPGGNPNSGVYGSESPIVRTTLTIPGAIPEGLPGTEGPRPKGPGGGPGKGGSRGNRHRRGRRPDEKPGNEAPRAPETGPADEDFNR